MTIKVHTHRHGHLDCQIGRDGAGNLRIFPVRGASLEVFRANPQTTIPPWLLEEDVAENWEELYRRAEAILL